MGLLAAEFELSSMPAAELMTWQLQKRDEVSAMGLHSSLLRRRLSIGPIGTGVNGHAYK